MMVEIELLYLKHAQVDTGTRNYWIGELTNIDFYHLLFQGQA